MATITDSWSNIRTSIINGTFSYAIGDTKQFTYGDGTTNHTVEAEVVYIKSNEKYVDFVLKNFDEKTTFEYQTGAVRSVSNSIPKERLDNIYADELPSDLKKAIIPVKKKYGYRIGQTSNYETLVLYLWLLNGYNVGFSGYSDENDGYKYTNITKIKKYQPDDVESSWWITSYSGNYKMTINENGNTFYSNRDEPNGLVFGFRIGKEPNTRDLLGEQETLDALIAHELTEFVENDVTSVRSYAFYSQQTLKSIILPNLTTGASSVFSGCSNLKKVYFPNLVSIDSYTIYNNSELEEIELPNLTTINSYNFQRCPKLLRIIIGTNNDNNIVNLFSSSYLEFSNIARAIIYVNDNLVESYRADTKWEHLASRIYGISDLYKYEWTDSEIEDDWETICTKIENGQAQYKIGQYKSVDLGAEGIIKFRISAVNADEKSDNSGTAKYTWTSENALATQRRYNDSGSVQVNWETSEIRSVLAETIFPLFPNVLKNNIKEVKKYTSIRDSSGTQDSSYLTNDKIWLLSSREIYLNTYYARETNGPIYDMAFTDDDSRKRSQVTTPQSYDRWWTRSDNSSVTYPTGVTSNGAVSGGSFFGQQTRACNIVIGFCT